MRKYPWKQSPDSAPPPRSVLPQRRNQMSVIPIHGPSPPAHDSIPDDHDPQRSLHSLLRFQRLFEISTDGILILDWSTGLIIDANPRALALLRIRRDEALSKSLYEVGLVESERANIAALRDSRRHLHLHHAHLASTTTTLQHDQVEVVYRSYATNDTKEIQCTIRAVVDDATSPPEAGRVIRELQSHVHDLQRREQHLRELANRDALTGLFNRRYLEDSLPRELGRSQRRGTPLSVVAMDIDRFKRFNDSFGHESGDAALRACARSMVTSLRSGDIACRTGGDEFILILPECSAGQARALVARLCTIIKRIRVRNAGRTLETLTLSAGICEAPEGASDSLRMLRAADEALYAAKRTGGDRVALYSVPAGPGDRPEFPPMRRKMRSQGE